MTKQNIKKICILCSKPIGNKLYLRGKDNKIDRHLSCDVNRAKKSK
jgi:hypothetical protein